MISDSVIESQSDRMFGNFCDNVIVIVIGSSMFVGFVTVLLLLVVLRSAGGHPLLDKRGNFAVVACAPCQRCSFLLPQ